MLTTATAWPSLTVCVSGHVSVDTDTARALADRTVDWLDIRETNPHGSTGLSVSACLEDGLKHGADIIGVIDDDACFKDVPNTFAKICEIFGNTELGMNGAGVCGPMQQYRHMAKYRNDPSNSYWRMCSNPWTTYGSQWYSAEMLRTTHSVWAPMMRHVRLRQDLAMFMISDIHGFPCYEFYVPGYQHKCGGGWPDRSITEEWYVHRLRQTYNDYSYMLSVMLPQFDDPQFYVDELHRTARSELKYFNGRIAHCDVSGWKTPVVSSLHDLLGMKL